MTKSPQAEIKRLADYLSGLEKDGKPLFPEARIPCHECDRFSVTCRCCEGKRYTVSLSREDWEQAFDRLRSAGVTKKSIRSYALIAFDSDPAEAWERCKWIEAHGIKPLPMWFHRLDALAHNVVTPEQTALGWTDYERRRIMQWFYQHKEAVA